MDRRIGGKGFDLKGKGKASCAEREKGKGRHDLLGSFPLGNGHRAYARTKETKRFPGKGLPPNLRFKNITRIHTHIGGWGQGSYREIVSFVRACVRAVSIA